MPYAVQQTDNQRRRGTYQFVQALSGAKSDQEVAAAVILLSGCQDNQLSFDGAVNGQFTGALLQTWASGAFQGDYRAFHSAILATMPPDQTPNLFTVGQVSPAFLGQRPFTINAASGLPSTSSGRPVLRQGATGGDVVYLQNRLIAHGHSVTPDGVFGPGTAAAVRAFQSARGLPADGVVGPMTWGQLDAAPMSTGGGMPVGGGTTSGSGTSSGGGTPGGGTSVGGNGSGSVTVVARPILRRGMTGEHVTYLQVRLADHGYSVTSDGIFGPGTEMAVRSFQRSNGLTADGIVGPASWAALG